MKFVLFCFREAPGSSAIKELSPSLMIVIAHVFHEHVSGGSKFPSTDIVGPKVGFRVGSSGNRISVNIPAASQPSTMLRDKGN